VQSGQSVTLAYNAAMPAILAIETSAEAGSIALLARDAVVERRAPAGTPHSGWVLPAIHAMLAEAGIGLASLDAIAFGAGPGSFTGLRLACGIAQGLALGADLPVVAACSLEALALRFPLERTLSDASAGRLTAARAWADAHPEAAGAFMWLGLLQSKAGGVDDALDTLKKAAAIAPADDDIRATYWIELGRNGRWADVVADAQTLDMKGRSWKVRWNEAEAYSQVGKKVEARACYTALNADESVPIEIRKRAKRAASE